MLLPQSDCIRKSGIFPNVVILLTSPSYRMNIIIDTGKGFGFRDTPVLQRDWNIQAHMPASIRETGVSAEKESHMQDLFQKTWGEEEVAKTSGVQKTQCFWHNDDNELAKTVSKMGGKCFVGACMCGGEACVETKQLQLTNTEWKMSCQTEQRSQPEFSYIIIW